MDFYYERPEGGRIQAGTADVESDGRYTASVEWNANSRLYVRETDGGCRRTIHRLRVVSVDGETPAPTEHDDQVRAANDCVRPHQEAVSMWISIYLNVTGRPRYRATQGRLESHFEVWSEDPAFRSIEDNVFAEFRGTSGTWLASPAGPRLLRGLERLEAIASGRPIESAGAPVEDAGER